MLTPLRCHWYDSGAVPEAETLKVTGEPALTVWLAGCVVIVGATARRVARRGRRCRRGAAARQVVQAAVARDGEVDRRGGAGREVATALPFAGSSLRIQPLQKSAKK